MSEKVRILITEREDEPTNNIAGGDGETETHEPEDEKKVNQKPKKWGLERRLKSLKGAAGVVGNIGAQLQKINNEKVKGLGNKLFALANQINNADTKSDVKAASNSLKTIADEIPTDKSGNKLGDAALLIQVYAFLEDLVDEQ